MTDHKFDDVLDVAVIGTGPAGSAAMLELVDYGVTAVLFGPAPTRDATVSKATQNAIDFVLPDTCFAEEIQDSVSIVTEDNYKALRVPRKITKMYPVDSSQTGCIQLADDENKIWTAKSVIVASGTTRKGLFPAGETKFDHCVSTDIKKATQVFAQPSTVTTMVMVAPATTATLLLAERLMDLNGAATLIVCTTAKFTPSIVLDRVLQRHKSQIQLEEDNVLTSLILDETDPSKLSGVTLGLKEVPCQFVLTLLGTVPNTTFLAGTSVALGSKKQVQTDEQFATSECGVFAAGSVRQCPCDVIDAIHQGRVAARQAIQYIERLRADSDNQKKTTTSNDPLD